MKNKVYAKTKVKSTCLNNKVEMKQKQLKVSIQIKVEKFENNIVYFKYQWTLLKNA